MISTQNTKIKILGKLHNILKTQIEIYILQNLKTKFDACYKKIIKNVQTCHKSIHCNILKKHRKRMIDTKSNLSTVSHLIICMTVLYLTLTQFSTQLSSIVDFPRKHVVMATINVPLTRPQLEHLLRRQPSLPIMQLSFLPLISYNLISKDPIFSVNPTSHPKAPLFWNFCL